MKISNLGVYGDKRLDTDLEICFTEQILDAVMIFIHFKNALHDR